MKYLLLFLLLFACTPLSETESFVVDSRGYEWTTTPHHVPLTDIEYRKVPTYKDLYIECGYPLGGNFDACAWRHYETGKCEILFVDPMTPYLKWHEEKHCAGYKHNGE